MCSFICCIKKTIAFFIVSQEQIQSLLSLLLRTLQSTGITRAQVLFKHNEATCASYTCALNDCIFLQNEIFSISARVLSLSHSLPLYLARFLLITTLPIFHLSHTLSLPLLSASFLASLFCFLTTSRRLQ